jgi:peptide/nickel transport system permease protein
MLSGLVITEEIFALPGIGRLALNSLFNRDFPVVQGVVLFVAVSVVLVNLGVDILYSFLDPRIRYGAKE